MPSNVSSEQIHNHNCYLYLRAITNEKQLPESIQSILPKRLGYQLNIVLKQNQYEPDYRYADLYRDFFAFIDSESEKIASRKKSLEDQLSVLKTRQGLRPHPQVFGDARERLNDPSRHSSQQEITVLQQQIHELEAFIHNIYANNNLILDATFETIKHIPANHKPTDKKIEKVIQAQLADKGNKRVNDAPSPADNQSLPSRVNATFGRNYKPQHNTLSTERRYQYNKDKKGPQELRFGTQAQRQDGQTKVSPAFKLWLKNQPSTTIASMFSPSSPAQRITHIYFNNLGRDRSDPEGLSERRMTQALENLENEHDNLAVITLPADKGLFAANDYQTTTENLNFDQEFQRLFNIATNNSSEAIKDFYISPSVRTMIYGDKEQETVNKLLSLSFSKMGAAADKPLSKAQRQAIWFDFNKYAFPNLAIETLDPKTFNFTCKDAIDRAGVSSAYYNLMKSIELENPMSREEFECGLHAAPAMVKGRGMNHHVELLWNAIDFYINANYEKLRGQVPWLVQWRDDNCPHNRAQEVLRIRIQQARIDLDKATCDFPLKKDQIAQTARLIDMIEEQAKKNTSGNRLLLQAVSDSIDLIENPSPRKVNSYKNLADRLEVKNPTWRAIGGIMKIIAGMITYAFSPKLLHSGIATFKTAQNAEQRKQIQLAMKKMIQKNEEEEIQPGHSTPIVG